MDVPADRPMLQVLLTRLESDRSARRFVVVDLLAWPYYESRGWEWVALDPEREAQWHAWRAANPNAA